MAAWPHGRSAVASLDGGLVLQKVQHAKDGTRKLIFGLADSASCSSGSSRGSGSSPSIEAVIIPVVRKQGLRDRLTLCVSSQVRGR